MARYAGSACRICRREGEKLFLKGYRCFTNKCAMEKRGFPPGQHGKRRGKTSDYGTQLREKQKVRKTYGLLERQFHKTFVRAERMHGVTGENLLSLLERRLDNVVFRSGFGSSRSQARQLVTHGHFLVNNKPVNIPSYEVRQGDVVSVCERSRQLDVIRKSIDAGREIPTWLDVNMSTSQSVIKALPTREDVKQEIQEQLIVELYSR